MDVMVFELHLEDNLFRLYTDLQNETYRHSPYKHFQIYDNKKRDIYKAEVRDRVVHQIIYDYLSQLFASEFISDSYASRIYKGQYKAINAFRYFIKIAQDHHKPCFVLKCDVRKYFDNIDQSLLYRFISNKIIALQTSSKVRIISTNQGGRRDNRLLTVIREIIESYTYSGLGKGAHQLT